jgi:hypothetical protein
MSTDTNYDLCQRIKPYVILCDIDLPCIVDFSPGTRGSYSIELVFLHEFQSRSGELYSIYHYCDKVCQWLPTGLWFSRRTPISSTYKIHVIGLRVFHAIYQRLKSNIVLRSLTSHLYRICIQVNATLYMLYSE